jgi:hypothetical protein
MVQDAVTPETRQHLAIVQPDAPTPEATVADISRLLHDRRATAAYATAKLAALDELRSAVNDLLEGLTAGATDDPAFLALRPDVAALAPWIARTEQRFLGLKRRAEDGTVSIAVVGPTGSGKSRFINAAAGTYLLPSHGGDQVSGPVVRVRHDPTATERRLVIIYEGDRPITLHGGDIDRALTQFDKDGTPNPDHRRVVYAEIQGNFPNLVARPAIWYDTPGLIAGIALNEDRMVRSIKQDCDVMLVIDKIPNDDDRSVLEASHHRIHALMAEVPSAFVVLNTRPASPMTVS